MEWSGLKRPSAVLVFLLLILSVGVAPVTAQDQEPNDDFDSAQAISEGARDGQIQNGESDFYKIDATTVDAIDLSLGIDSDSVNLVLYGPDRRQLGSDFVDRTGRAEITRKVPENGTYYIEVVGTNAGTTTSYDLDVDVITPSENDEFAPNDDFDSAADVPERVSRAKIWGGESDFYKIDATTVDAIDLSLGINSDSVNLVLYGPDRRQLGGDFVDRTGRAEITRKVPENGTYYIEVVGTNAGTTTSYDLDVDVITPSENDEFAPNDDFDSAAPINNEVSRGKIWGGESDLYAVGLDAGEQVSLEVGINSDSVNLVLYGPNREQLGRDFVDRTGRAEITRTVSESGTYYVEVVGTDAGTTTNYRLISNRTGVPEDTDPLTPVERFDTNGEPGIQGDEVLDAISEFNEGGDVEATDVLDVISAFNENSG
ncbi:hypothetical protein DP107_18880 [Haloglomus irregulare]|uniref:Pre-peptidase C-terminal domain-containing protein n=1 Tax=Haloglomus irregulare TaxID=2234134 RepID=A0A554MU34_9EURY|nr:hypothetical protein [Haloglomus irregulare]TSD08642.1 hypothetical protein DP107_18880 [Haloglomus irregulare]